MKNAYQYLDPDYLYIDPTTGIMRNKAGIGDNDLLTAFEGLTVSNRLEELRARPVRIKNTATLLDIHRHLFQDVYEWAGQIRTVEISKSGTPFFSLGYFHRAFPYIDTMIAEYRGIDKNDKPALALEKDLDLNLNPPDDVDIYERYMSGTINGNVKLLSELILDII